MANVGSGAAGKTLIGTGNGASPTFATIGTDSGLTAHGVVIAEGNGAFTATSAGSSGQVLISNGTTDPTFQPVSASGSLTSITGNTGGAQTPLAGNFNLVTANTTLQFAGTANTETLDFNAPANLMIGSTGPIITSGTANITYGPGSGAQLTTGSSNILIGQATGSSIRAGSDNVVVANGGANTLGSGNWNSIYGANGGANYTAAETSNVLLANAGVSTENNTMRLGTTGTGNGQVSTSFVAAVAAVTVSNPRVVVINSATEQLGSIAMNQFSQVNIQSFITAGTATYTPTTGMKYCVAECIGGGAAGGGAQATGAGNVSVAGGGGSGQYSLAVFTAATIGASQTVTIGAGGTANSGATGGNGGTSSLGALLTSGGGSGGVSGASGIVSSANGGTGGSGGTGSVFTSRGNSGLGAAASVAGTIGFSGAGANSQFGAGGTGLYSGSGAGNAGTGHGSGGGGGMNQASQSATNGGVGQPGAIIITEYI